MNLIPTKIAGCYRVETQILRDARGTFTNVFDLEALRRVDPSFAVLRVNRSLTRTKGTIRGLHFQDPPYAEDKLVQCLQGAVFDVSVDLRRDSPTYLQWVGVELSAENQEMLWVPRGCAHGLQTLREDTVVEYFVTAPYSPAHERGVRWDDPAVKITWPLPCSLTSEKDGAWPLIPRAS